MKSVFQLGGAGSVGLQSLWGMYHLANIIVFCEENQIPLHCWPYDGINIPGEKHVLIEIYPGTIIMEKRAMKMMHETQFYFFLRAKVREIWKSYFKSLSVKQRVKL